MEDRNGDRRALRPDEVSTFKRLGIRVIVLLVTSTVLVDVVRSFLEESDVIGGRITWSLLIQVVLLALTLHALYLLMPLARKWLEPQLRRFLKGRLSTEPTRLQDLADAVVRLGVLLIVALLVIPPVGRVVGSKVAAVLKMAVLAYGGYLGYRIYRVIEEFLAGGAAASPAPPEEGAPGPAPRSPVPPADAQAESTEGRKDPPEGTPDS